MDISQVNEKDLISFKSDERTMERGIDWAIPILMDQQKDAKNYEHWFFEKHPESWRGWYIHGVRKGIYDCKKNAIVPKKAKKPKEEK